MAKKCYFCVMLMRFISFMAAAALAASARAELPQELPEAAPDSLSAPAPALPPARILSGYDDGYVPSCLTDGGATASRFSFSAPAYTPVIASWGSGGVWADAGSAHAPGMAAVESGMLGVSHSMGNVTVSGYAGAVKTAYFRGLSTQWMFGGEMQWRFAPRLSLTLFGSYATRGYRPGMAPGVAETLAVPSFGGYVSWDITDHFGVDVGASAYYNNLRQWEARPIVAPYYKAGAAKISVDVGGILYETLRSRSGGGPHNPTIAPPRPIIPIAPRD